MTRSRIDPLLVRTLWIGLGAAVVCTGCLPSCQFKDPFFANVTVTTVDGKLVDYAMVGMARRVLAWAGAQKD